MSDRGWRQDGVAGSFSRAPTRVRGLDAFEHAIRQHFDYGHSWMIVENGDVGSVVVLCFHEPKFGLMYLEGELRENAPAGVLVEVLLVHPDLDRAALDTIYRLNGAAALLRAIR